MTDEYDGLVAYVEQEEPELLERVGNEPIKSWKNDRSRLISTLLTRQRDQNIVLTPQQVPELVDGDVDVVVHMGCHVIQTPHIIDATIDVLEAFGFTIVPLGGFNNCCGSLDLRQGTFEDAEQVDDVRFANVRAFDPEYLITECTSCFANTERFSAKYREFDGFEFASMIDFLHQRRDELKDLVAVSDPVTVAFHDHYDPSRWTSKRQGKLARELFDALPGVEVVEMEHSLAESLPCNFLADPSEYGYDDFTAQVYEEAVAAGADLLVNFWHACHRHMVVYDEQYPIETRNYTTFLAERLGFSYRDVSKAYRVAAANGDIEWILEDARPIYEANGLTTTEAREIIESHLIPGEV